MDGCLYMPEISEEEFVANIERDDFCRRYGNPVRIREKNGDSLVCMAIEYYERMMQRLEAFCEYAASHEDDNIRYWIYEFEMPQEKKDKLEEIARENEMTVDEFFQAAVLSAIEHPKEAAATIRREQDSDEDCDIRLVRKYPVYKGETEAQARKRAIAEEEAAKADGQNCESIQEANGN